MKSEGFVVSFVLCSAERELNVGWNGYILYIGIALILCPLRGNFSYFYTLVPHMLCSKTCSAACFAKF